MSINIELETEHGGKCSDPGDVSCPWTSLGAQGVVGVNIVEDSRDWGSHVIEFFAVGTAIIPISAEHQIQPPALTLSLSR